MSHRVFWTSLTRRSDLRTVPFEMKQLPREEWATADYVLGQVNVARGALARVELDTGRMTEVVERDLVMGALGVRFATLEAVGSWRDIPPSGQMELLTSAGLFGGLTSVSLMLPPLVSCEYLGHAIRDGKKVTMADFVPPARMVTYDRPTILCVGTSMSSGKTTAAKVIVRLLKEAGLKVVGCKLTGAARYRDVLRMRDAGADAIFDFVDVGLPSSIVPSEEYETRLRHLLALIQAELPDVVVAEAGASPLEPYNGDTVMRVLGDHARCIVLAASDPYAVVGVIKGFDRKPDIVSGIAASTAAGVALIEKLTGLTALNVLDPNAREPIWQLIKERISAPAS